MPARAFHAATRTPPGAGHATGGVVQDPRARLRPVDGDSKSNRAGVRPRALTILTLVVAAVSLAVLGILLVSNDTDSAPPLDLSQLEDEGVRSTVTISTPDGVLVGEQSGPVVIEAEGSDHKGGWGEVAVFGGLAVLFCVAGVWNRHWLLELRRLEKQEAIPEGSVFSNESTLRVEKFRAGGFAVLGLIVGVGALVVAVRSIPV